MKAYLGNRIGLAVTGAVLAGAGLYGFLRGEERSTSRVRTGSWTRGSPAIWWSIPGWAGWPRCYSWR